MPYPAMLSLNEHEEYHEHNDQEGWDGPQLQQVQLRHPSEAARMEAPGGIEMDRQAEAQTEAQAEAQTKVRETPDIPINVIVAFIVPFLRRPEWNAMCLANRELNAYMWRNKTAVPPWPRTRVRVRQAIVSLSVSPDNGIAAFGDRQGRVYLMDSRKGEIVHVGEGHFGDVSKLCFSPNGAWLASAGTDRSIVLWNLVDYKNPYRSQRGLPLWEKLLDGGHTDAITSIAFSADSQVLVSGGYDRVLRIWDVGTGQQIQCPQGWEGATRGYVQELQWSPCINTLPSMHPPKTKPGMTSKETTKQYALLSVELGFPVHVWELELSTTTCTPTISKPREIANTIPSTAVTAATSATANPNETTVEHSIGRCDCIKYGSDESRVQAACFNNDATTIVILYQHCYLEIWDRQTRQCQRTIPVFRDAAYLVPSLHPRTTVLHSLMMTQAPDMRWAIATATTKTLFYCKGGVRSVDRKGTRLSANRVLDADGTGVPTSTTDSTAGTGKGSNSSSSNNGHSNHSKSTDHTPARHPKMKRRSTDILSRERETVQCLTVTNNHATVFAAIGGSLSGPNTDSKYICIRHAP